MLFLPIWISATLAISPAVAKVSLNRVEATVNSAAILNSDLIRFRRLMPLRAQLDRLFVETGLAKKGAAATDAEIAEFLIQEKLITTAYPVTDQEVEQTITQIVTNNRSTRDALKAALKAQGFSYDDYYELMRVSRSVMTAIETEIRQKVSISDEDVRNEYLNHASRSEINSVTDRIQLLFISLKSYKTPEAALKVAQAAYQAIRNGEDFNEVANRMGDGNGDQKSTLIALPQSQLSPGILAQVRGLKVGDVTPPFGGKKDGGYSVLKLLDRTFDESDQFNQAKEEIRNRLAAAEFQRQVLLWVERQKQKASIHRAGEPTTQGSAVPSKS